MQQINKWLTTGRTTRNFLATATATLLKINGEKQTKKKVDLLQLWSTLPSEILYNWTSGRFFPDGWRRQRWRCPCPRRQTTPNPTTNKRYDDGTSIFFGRFLINERLIGSTFGYEAKRKKRSYLAVACRKIWRRGSNKKRLLLPSIKIQRNDKIKDYKWFFFSSYPT